MNAAIKVLSPSVSARTLKTLKYFPKILFNVDIMDLCLLLHSCILFKSRFESHIKVLVSELVLAFLKSSEPVDSIFDGILLSKSGIQTIEKRNWFFLSRKMLSSLICSSEGKDIYLYDSYRILDDRIWHTDRLYFYNISILNVFDKFIK